MFKVVIVGFGSIGYRYFEAINRIKLLKIKIFLVDPNIKTLMKNYNLDQKKLKHSDNLKIIPKKINLCIVSTTCNKRYELIKDLIKITNFQNLIIEKPLTQSPAELQRLNKVLNKKKNVWVNTDRRCLDIYKFIKSKIKNSKKISMEVVGNSWGICCNSLHFVDLFNFLTNKSLDKIEEKSKLKWFPSKRKGFYDLDHGEIKLKFEKHDLFLKSKKKASQKNINIIIKYEDKIFLIKEKLNKIELKYNNDIIFFKNEFTSVKMIGIIKRILLYKKSNLPTYIKSSKLYHPLIKFFLKKWQSKFPDSRKVPIT